MIKNGPNVPRYGIIVRITFAEILRLKSYKTGILSLKKCSQFLRQWEK